MRLWTLCLGRVVISLLRPAAAIACACGGAVPVVGGRSARRCRIPRHRTRIERPQPIGTFHRSPDGSGSGTVDVNGSGPDLVLFDVTRSTRAPMTRSPRPTSQGENPER
jgi:hypothetical protein